MVFRDRISMFALDALQILAWILPFNIYGAVPIPASESSPSVPDLTLIYDVLPVSPIPVEPGGKYSEKWGFPADYVLDKTYPQDTDIGVATDNKGSMKCYEYDAPSETPLINSGWGFTITKEGSIIYHGPKNDPRSEVCILVPLGWNLDGVEIGETMNVIRAIAFGPEVMESTWERDLSFVRQYFTILYNIDTFPKLIIQEVTWDTDTLDPVVKTTFPDEQLHRYDIKEFQPYWYQATALVSNVQRFAPTPVFRGVRRLQMQYRVAKGLIDGLRAKYAAESATFDKYRDPAQIP